MPPTRSRSPGSGRTRRARKGTRGERRAAQTTGEPLIELERIYTTREAAGLLGLDPDTVTAYIHRKLLAGFKPGHDWLIRGSEVQAFIARRRRPGRPTRAVP